MKSGHIPAGVALLAAAVVFLVAKYARAPRRGRFRAWGWAGLGVILTAEFLLVLRSSWVATFFTPVVWTGYLLFVDALVAKLQGASLLSRSPRSFFAMAFWSVPLWLVFEAYNLRLENWTYVGLPASPVTRGIGYVWSFATIWPAIFETADFLRALGLGRHPEKPGVVLGRRGRNIVFIVGAAALILPVILPRQIGQYLFGAVWFGFVLLLDPVNYSLNSRSLVGEWEKGGTSTLARFLVAGLTCGILWEFWNYWAQAKWLYIFPIFQSAKVFEMPAPGYLGFPPFGLECFVMYEFLVTLRGRLAGWRRDAGRNRPVPGADSPARGMGVPYPQA